MLRVGLTSVALLVLAGTAAMAQEPWIPEKVDALCEGPAAIPAEARARVVLDNDGTEAEMLYAAGITCDDMAGPFCGSGGCSLWARIEGQTYEWQAEGWRIIEWADRPILLIARDGGWCGGAGAELCFEALTWSAGRFLTVMPPS